MPEKQLANICILADAAFGGTGIAPPDNFIYGFTNTVLHRLKMNLSGKSSAMTSV